MKVSFVDFSLVLSGIVSILFERLGSTEEELLLVILISLLKLRTSDNGVLFVTSVPKLVPG